MVKKIVTFFDKLEDRVRIRLSHNPILYALVGAVGIILLWKGVWEVAELIPALHGFGSLIAGIIILLMSGLLVSFFIGDSIILSGFKKEKKLVEKSELDILKAEESQTTEIMRKLEHLEKDIHELKGDHRHNV
ncbi:hypothetical protein EXS62_00575 [Candidatus Kaiserbacteria bacterium]|nr:hypothetical protein [Candidatus Kaiserbacteria bacterium]